MQNVRLRAGFGSLSDVTRLSVPNRAAIISALAVYMIYMYTTMIMYCAHTHNLVNNEESSDDALHVHLENDTTLIDAATAYETMRGVGPNVLKLIVCALRSIATQLPLVVFTRPSNVPPNLVEYFNQTYPVAVEYLRSIEPTLVGTARAEESALYSQFIFACIEAAMEEAAAADVDQYDDADDTDDVESDNSEDDTDAVADDNVPAEAVSDTGSENSASESASEGIATTAFNLVPAIVYDETKGHCVCEFCESVREALSIATQNDGDVKDFVATLISQAFETELAADE
jgi:hypothetical protein